MRKTRTEIVTINYSFNEVVENGQLIPNLINEYTNQGYIVINPSAGNPTEENDGVILFSKPLPL